MDDFLYDIKYSDSNDIITLFKTLEINEENSEYMYTLMSNPNIYDCIDKVTQMFINNKVYSIFFEIIDGWVDNISNIVLYKNLSDLKDKIAQILRKILYTDMIDCEQHYIDDLNKHFGINYYAEKMAG